MTSAQKREAARVRYYKKLGREVPPLKVSISKAARARRKTEKTNGHAKSKQNDPKAERGAFVSDAKIYITHVLRCISTDDLEGIELYAKLAQRALKGKV